MSVFHETEEHRHYLADTRRTELYSRALAEVIGKDSTVLDLGCGTGILGLLACRAGARKVYAIDGGNIIELAREIADANGLREKIEHRQALSTEATLPERVDVVVADQIGRFGLECGIWETLADACKRLLKPRGVCVPRSLQLHIAPVEAPDEWQAANFWSSKPADLDLSPGLRWALNTPRPVSLTPKQVLAEPDRSDSIHLQTAPRMLKLDASFKLTRAATVHGIAGWFSTELSPSVQVTNSPLLPRERIDRDQLLFLIERPLVLNAGAQISVSLTLAADVMSWSVSFGSECCSHSTFLGRLISREELQTSQPEFVPALSAVGEARRLVLNLCDGVRSTAAIERELMQRFPQLFPTSREAAPFVAETVLRYSRLP
ncbi:MAG TPA: 50S ribosomal protein L11 methyltransferase [Planctomycetota bacterium]|nr:50S ribosomal protein L11 methyltransferase [Planctomycetota bacterium]